MKKKLIIKNEVVEMTFEEVLEQFTPAIHKEINKQKAKIDRPEEERDDMFQSASMWLWEAYKKEDADKGFHFHTIALQYIRRGVQEEARKRNTQKRKGETISMDENLGTDDEEFSLNNILSEEVDYDSPMIAREIITEAIETMTDLEVEYLVLMLNDYTPAEIGRERGVARGTASEKHKKIREKVRLVAMKYNY